MVFIQIRLKDGTEFNGNTSMQPNSILRIETLLAEAPNLLLIVTNGDAAEEITEVWKTKLRIYRHFSHLEEVRIKDGNAVFYLSGGSPEDIEEKWIVPEEYLPEDLRKEDNIQNGPEDDDDRSNPNDDGPTAGGTASDEGNE